MPQPRALGFLNCVDPMDSMSNLYVVCGHGGSWMILKYTVAASNHWLKMKITGADHNETSFAKGI